VKDEAFSSLDESDYICEVIMYSSNQDITLLSGEEVELYCNYYADPFQLPKWTKNGKEIITTQAKYRNYEIPIIIKRSKNPPTTDNVILMVWLFLELSLSSTSLVVTAEGLNLYPFKETTLVKDEAFSSLDENDYICEVIMYSSNQDITLLSGEEVELYCNYYADPFQLPKWTKTVY
jgi:hypothetical protein